ncbi:MAG: exodeoxyribonuclease III [Alphaproteobacteria bacterium]|nr:exodeoxyribonuclease III [Alphaproteobacteria bacterium]
MVKIATYNVNSINAHLEVVLDWLAAADIDVLLMQEIKCEWGAFPTMMFKQAGYNCAVLGQKSYNGVAIASKFKLDNVVSGLPGLADDQARFIQADTCGLTIANVYVPNGNPVETKLDYKLEYMKALNKYAASKVNGSAAFVLGGDFNVIIEDRDAYDIAQYRTNALAHPSVRAAFRQCCNLGFTNAFRAVHPDAVAYTWYSYSRGQVMADHGLLIDHILLNPSAADRLRDAGVDKSVRMKSNTSDHVPLICELA